MSVRLNHEAFETTNERKGTSYSTTPYSESPVQTLQELNGVSRAETEPPKGYTGAYTKASSCWSDFCCYSDACPRDKFTLVTLPLPRAPPYRVLSYYRGNPNNTTSIIVNGIKIQVTASLEAALRRLRSERVKTVWAASTRWTWKNEVSRFGG
jgi:Heterokaryon incompatibility protein (HET)